MNQVSLLRRFDSHLECSAQPINIIVMSALCACYRPLLCVFPFLSHLEKKGKDAEGVAEGPEKGLVGKCRVLLLVAQPDATEDKPETVLGTQS